MNRALGCVIAGSVFVVVVVFVGGACDPRPTLAQSGFFDGFRKDLVDDCCRCLSRRGTDDVAATCSAARIVDGGVVVDDADAVFGDPSADGLDDLDDEIDPGEVPCLCAGDEDTCVKDLESGRGVTIPGACIDQLTRTAPCENACLNVLNFDPLPTE